MKLVTRVSPLGTVKFFVELSVADIGEIFRLKDDPNAFIDNYGIININPSIFYCAFLPNFKGEKEFALEDVLYCITKEKYDDEVNIINQFMLDISKSAVDEAEEIEDGPRKL